MQMMRSISVRSAEKGPSQLLGGELSGLGQGRSEEGRTVESDDYFEGVVVELTDLCVMSLLVTCYPPTATSHMSAAPSLHTASLPTHLLPLAFGTPAASAHADSLQHHLYPLFKGWGQLGVSPFQGPPLGTDVPE